MKTIIVYDANILIDFCELGMLPSLFRLGYTMCTVDFVYGELLPAQRAAYQPYIVQGLLQVESLREDKIIEVIALRKQKPQLSQADCSALVYARDKEGILLTSDMNLRKTAQRLQTEVHGHLWVFDRLYEQHILSGPVLIGYLKTLNEEVNLWLSLPKEECEKRIKIWKQ